jgi:hypothetical protein
VRDLKTGEKDHRRPDCVPGVTAGKSANGCAGKIRLRAFDRLNWWDQDTGGDAYDTLGSATCVTLRPRQRHPRPSACAGREGPWPASSRSGYALQQKGGAEDASDQGGLFRNECVGDERLSSFEHYFCPVSNDEQNPAPRAVIGRAFQVVFLLESRSN